MNQENLNQDTVKKPEEEYIFLLTNLYREIDSLQEDVKSLKESAEEDGYDSKNLITLSKLLAKGKDEEFVVKTKSTLEYVLNNR